eukprot:gnl/MRDRNA2_/MRDRNA2_42404_c0_seq1.p2 gnl/MRDRNA2_/MRDRNA2_42404_c0~~gnl/MRDRNA2_/MRDRNA2_42404_c0_seq1.p2  ORF type:complete len:133 (+),score=21.69 gnl/MRDRNA2_/MRDRNA2_42404_c0_seq1:3-401(+)
MPWKPLFRKPPKGICTYPVPHHVKTDAELKPEPIIQSASPKPELSISSSEEESSQKRARIQISSSSSSSSSNIGPAAGLAAQQTAKNYSMKNIVFLFGWSIGGPVILVTFWAMVRRSAESKIIQNTVNGLLA